MKNLALPSELMAFINESGKFVFIDDFSGWGEEAQLKNFRFGPAMEGNKLIADTGEEFGFQYVSMRRGNHLTVQLRDHREKSCQQLKLADLPIFREFDVVIWTSGESLQGFAPVCRNKFELAVFLQNLEDYDAPDDYRWSRTKAEMASLANSCTRTTPTKPNPFWTIWIKKIINRFSTRPHRRVFYFRIHLNWLSLLPRRLYRLTALFCLSASS